ncbi:MAG: radical SAM protein [Candidatus Omnitrophica bacterium]|nr:radical SAM protein [Candidatus Omnitrophota bacterium]
MDLKPRIIFWETTNQCNLQCCHCRMSKNKSGIELNTAEAFKFIKELKDNFGPVILVLSGGEPLLRTDIFDIIAFAKEQGITTALATNGTLLGLEQALKLKALGINRVSLSLDSVIEKIHDAARGCLGAFKKTNDAADILHQQGIPFQINYTVTKANKNDLRAVAELALSIGACAVHYFILVPVGCGKEIEKEAMLDAEDNEQVLGIIKGLAEEFSIEIRPTCAPQYARLVRRASLAHHSMASGCLAGTGTFFISSYGDIYPCGYLPVKAGSIRESSIAEIWQNSLVFNNLRTNDLKGGCSTCGVKEKCRGCRARAYGVTGDYMAGDVTCVLSKR